MRNKSHIIHNKVYSVCNDMKKIILKQTSSEYVVYVTHSNIYKDINTRMFRSILKDPVIFVDEK